MSLSIFEHGDGRYRLVHRDREVGSLEQRTLTISGFADAAAARDAASTAYDALAAWLSRQRHVDAMPRRGRPLKVRPHDADRALTLGGVRVGRLIEGTPSGSHGFQLFLPPRLTATLVAAQLMFEALLRKRSASFAGSAAAEYVAIGGPLQ